MASSGKMITGWREWCALPELGLPAIKAKVDTGAATSALHAFHIEPFDKKGEHYVRFCVHPIQNNSRIVRICTAPLVDNRHVTASSGHGEHRHVIKTSLLLGGQTWEIEITLTNRAKMSYNMLLGREAMRKRIIVDPAKSFCQGRINKKQSLAYYTEETLQQE